MLNLNSDFVKVRATSLLGPFLYLPWYWAMPILYPGSWNPFWPRFAICLFMWATAAYTFYRPKNNKTHNFLMESVFYLIVLHHFIMAYENNTVIIYRYTFFLVTVMGGAMMSSMRSFVCLVVLALVCKLIIFAGTVSDPKFEIFEFFLWLCQFIIIGWLIRSIFQGRLEIFALSKKSADSAIAIEVAKATLLEAEKKLLEKDLAIAGGVQTLLLPKFDRINSGPLEVCAYFQPALKTGGDWWWFSELSDGRVRLFMGDVTGHGAGPAMVTALVAGCYQTAIKLIQDAPIENLLEIINQRMQESCQDQHWMTFSAIEIDPVKNHTEFWSMASPDILVTSASHVESLHGNEKSRPLGSGPLNFTKVSRAFSPGDQMLIFTDGLYEFVDKSKRQFGMRRLQNLYSDSLPIENLNEQVQYLATKSSDLRLHADLEDDITFAVIRFNSAS